MKRPIKVDKSCNKLYNMNVTKRNNFVTNKEGNVTMIKKLLKTIGLFSVCTMLMTAAPLVAFADQENPEYQTSTSMVVRVEAEVTDVYTEADSESSVIGQASKGSTYEIIEVIDGEWAKVPIGENEGYINTIDAAATVAETVEEVVIDASELLREEIVNCGMGFVGNRYVWGGIDPHKGADCSGFTMYIMREVAGVTLSHSSRAQGNEGRVISAEEMRPGDLVFYGSGKRINHVAIYAGDGMIVHASNEEDGIKVSPWNYRKPIKIVNVLGD